MSTKRDERVSRLKSEGDVNLTVARANWSSKSIDTETQRWLDEDERYFLHQSLSTPCLNVLKGCDGVYMGYT